MSTSIKLSKMKSICLLLFFSLQIYNTGQTAHKYRKGFRIPLFHSSDNSQKNGSRFARRFFPANYNEEHGVFLTNFSFYSSPPVSVNIMFDSLANFSWVYSKFYDYCDENALAVYKKNRLDPWSNQRTTKADFYEHRDGWVFGFMLKNITLILPTEPPHNNYYRFKMPFLEVKKASKSIVDQPFDAVIGIGPHSSIWKVCDETDRPSRIGLALPPLNAETGTRKGELVLCGFESNIFETNLPTEPMDVPSSNPHRWEVKFRQIDYAKVTGGGNEYNILGENVNVQFDINSPYFTVPKRIIDKIKTLVNITEDPETQDLMVTCDNNALFPILSFFTNETHHFFLTGDEYTLRKRLPDNNLRCKILFKASSKKDWIMGNFFMRKYYILFREPPYTTLGFVERKRKPQQRSDVETTIRKIQKRYKNQHKSY